MTNNVEALIRTSPRTPSSSSQGALDRDPDSLDLEHSDVQVVANANHDHFAIPGNNNNDGSVGNNNVQQDVEPVFDAENLDEALVEAVAEGLVEEFAFASGSGMDSASQGSDYFAPASPTYPASLPCMSQSSQDSFSSSAGAIMNMESQFIFPAQSELNDLELNLAISEFSEVGSQPEAKRRRLDDR